MPRSRRGSCASLAWQGCRPSRMPPRRRGKTPWCRLPGPRMRKPSRRPSTPCARSPQRRGVPPSPRSCTSRPNGRLPWRSRLPGQALGRRSCRSRCRDASPGPERCWMSTRPGGPT
ncbi:hypothetical protein EAH86_12180 [Pedococcus bigeumensis]|uniref:Uncharacterized protein n=1 Tax=Pedococcus bigeumensis TaxID=433644 RepID=A0A502CQS8_9MICO|nr:hypothetical protein EAH86_12180 [Pedococcus bigeumensis]